MKRILLLLFMLNGFSIAFCQSENITRYNRDLEVVKGMFIALEEVAINSKNNRKTEIYCKKNCVAKTTTTISCGFQCESKGVLIENLTQEINDIKLYPNPSTNGFFNLKIKEKYNLVQVEVSSITGQRVFTKTFQNITNKISLNLSKYPSGIYLINFIADGKRLPTKKVIRG